MELIVISETKIKIMLTSSDMRRYQVSSASAAPAPGPGLRRLLADIRRKCGLQLCEDRLMVDLYTSEAGCEMFLTSLGPREPITEPHTAKKPASPCERTVSPPCKTVASPQAKKAEPDGIGLTYAESVLLDRIRAMDTEAREEVLAFADVHDLIRLCRRLESVGFDGESAVYIDNIDRTGAEATWYLWLTFPTSEEEATLPFDRFAFLDEYADPTDVDHARICRGEYWSVIAEENAVSILGMLA